MERSTLDRVVASIFLLIIVVLVGLDLRQDQILGTSWRHMVVEVLVAIFAMAGLVALWLQNFGLKKTVVVLDQKLTESEERGRKWQIENRGLISGLSNAIDQQLSAWKLTLAEKDIALLLLKGLSLKEVADLRQTSERTVRQQSLAIYQKSGLKGRAELAAYFLEDLMVPRGES